MNTKTLVWILSIAAVILVAALSFIGYEWRAMNIREQAVRWEAGGAEEQFGACRDRR